jgi:hypothetical protein
MAEQGEPGEDCGGWRLMPVELTLQVFFWLEPGDLVRAELVCRRWRATYLIILTSLIPILFIW